MHKRDYETIAAVIKETLNVIDNAQATKQITEAQWDLLDKSQRKVVYQLCESFKIDNPRFDADKFCIACGYKSYKADGLNQGLLG